MKSSLRETIAAETLSVINLIIEEVFARKKRGAGFDHADDAEAAKDSDDFLFGQPYVELLTKLTKRVGEIISKHSISNSNLAYQLASFVANVVTIKNPHVDSRMKIAGPSSC